MNVDKEKKIAEANVFAQEIMRQIIESDIELPTAFLALMMVQEYIKEAVKNPVKTH